MVSFGSLKNEEMGGILGFIPENFLLHAELMAPLESLDSKGKKSNNHTFVQVSRLGFFLLFDDDYCPVTHLTAYTGSSV